MTDLRKAAEQALEALNIHMKLEVLNILTPLNRREFELRNSAVEALRQALAEPANSTTKFVEPKASSQTEQKPWVKTYCGGKPNYCTPDVAAVNMSQERVDETAKREHEPVAYEFIPNKELLYPHELERQPDANYIPLYTAPPKREWVGLTDTQVEEIANYHGIDGLYETSCIDFYRAIEITLKEKNHG